VEGMGWQILSEVVLSPGKYTGLNKITLAGTVAMFVVGLIFGLY
jgi:hypothetical protein